MKVWIKVCVLVILLQVNDSQQSVTTFAVISSADSIWSATVTHKILVIDWSRQASTLYGHPGPGLWLKEYSFNHCYQHKVWLKCHIQHVQQFSKLAIKPHIGWQSSPLPNSSNWSKGGCVHLQGMIPLFVLNCFTMGHRKLRHNEPKWRLLYYKMDKEN